MTDRQRYFKLKKFLSMHGLNLEICKENDDMYGIIHIGRVVPNGKFVACQMSSNISAYGEPAVIYFTNDMSSYRYAWYALKGKRLFDPINFNADFTYCIVPDSDEELEMQLAICQN